MGTYRQSTLASLCLLLAVSAVAACAVLLCPTPAGAQGNKARQLIFGPVQVTHTQSIFFGYFNSGTLPTPPATVVFRDLLSGAVEGTTVLPSVPPGVGAAGGLSGGDKVYVAVVTYGRPGPGQAIPKLFPCNVEVVQQSSGEVTAILDPLR